jgi:hypothetical protein
MSAIPPWIVEATGEAKRRLPRSDESELGAPRDQLSQMSGKPTPELLASRIPSKMKPLERGTAGKPEGPSIFGVSIHGFHS